MLHDITGVLAREHINILHVGIHRLGPYAALGRVGLDVIVDTRDRSHAEDVLALIRRNGFPAEELLDTTPGAERRVDPVGSARSRIRGDGPEWSIASS